MAENYAVCKLNIEQFPWLLSYILLFLFQNQWMEHAAGRNFNHRLTLLSNLIFQEFTKNKSKFTNTVYNSNSTTKSLHSDPSRELSSCKASPTLVLCLYDSSS